jgi:hypothetical protein
MPSSAGAVSALVAAGSPVDVTRLPVGALPRSRPPPEPSVPAMARPAIPARGISLNVVPEPTPNAAPAVALTLVAGNANATGRTAGVAAVQVGGTDSAPTVFAWPSPAATDDADTDEPRFVITGNDVAGTGPVPGQGCIPAQPARIPSVDNPVSPAPTS